MNGVKEKLNCVFLWWTTEDEIDFTLKYIEQNLNEENFETGEWFDIVPLDTIYPLINV